MLENMFTEINNVVMYVIWIDYDFTKYCGCR